MLVAEGAVPDTDRMLGFLTFRDLACKQACLCLPWPFGGLGALKPNPPPVFLLEAWAGQTPAFESPAVLGGDWLGLGVQWAGIAEEAWGLGGESSGPILAVLRWPRCLQRCWVPGQLVVASGTGGTTWLCWAPRPGGRSFCFSSQGLGSHLFPQSQPRV